jgi:hypothetical protein
MMLTVMTCWCWLIRTKACHRYMVGGGRAGQHDVNSFDMLVVAYQNYGMSQIHGWGMEDRPVFVGEGVETNMVLTVMTCWW